MPTDPFAKRFQDLTREFKKAHRFEKACAFLTLHLEWAEATQKPDPETALKQYDLAAGCQAEIGTFATGSGEGLESMDSLYRILKKKAKLLEHLADSASDPKEKRKRLSDALEIWKEIADDPNRQGGHATAVKKVAEIESQLG